MRRSADTLWNLTLIDVLRDVDQRQVPKGIGKHLCEEQDYFLPKSNDVHLCKVSQNAYK